MYTFNTSPQETEIGGSSWVLGQSGLPSEFPNRLQKNYRETLARRKKKLVSVLHKERKVYFTETSR